MIKDSVDVIARKKEKFEQESVGHFQFIWDHLDDEERKVLHKVAMSVKINELEKGVVNKLERKGIIQKIGETYTPFSKTFKVFVNCHPLSIEHHPIDKTLKFGEATPEVKEKNKEEKLVSWKEKYKRYLIIWIFLFYILGVLIGIAVNIKWLGLILWTVAFCILLAIIFIEFNKMVKVMAFIGYSLMIIAYIIMITQSI